MQNNKMKTVLEGLPNIIICNLTGNDITLLTDEGNIVIHSTMKAEASEVREMVKSVGGIPLYRIDYYNITGIPSRISPDVYYIVSETIAKAMNYRGDLVIPTDATYDSSGKLIGYRGLSFF